MHEITNQSPYKEFLAPKTEETRITYARILAMIRKHLGKEVHEATKEELMAFFLDLKKRGIKVTTQQTYKATLASFFKELAIIEFRKENPMLYVSSKIDTKNKDETVRRALTPAQRQKVYDCLIWEGENCSIHEYQMSLAILFGFKVGLRRFEIAKVQWDDIDFQKEEITVLGKGAKKATVNLSATMIQRLKGLQTLIDKAGIDTRWVFYKSDCHTGPLKGTVDPSKHLSKFSIGYWFKVIGKRAGFGKDILFSSHDGRRIFCTTLHEKKVDNLLAIKMSRHKSVGMFDKYVRKDEEKIKGELNRAID